LKCSAASQYPLISHFQCQRMVLDVLHCVDPWHSFSFWASKNSYLVAKRTISFQRSSVYVHFSSARSQRIRSRDSHSSLESAAVSCRPAASQRPVTQWKSTAISTEGWIPELLFVRCDAEEMHLQGSAIIVSPRWPFATRPLLRDPYPVEILPVAIIWLDVIVEIDVR